MRKTKKLPTIFGLVILVAGLVAGIFLLNSRQIFRLGATVENTPKDVRISNLSSKGFTVSWTTQEASLGFLKWGGSSAITNKVALEGKEEKSIVHSVNITDAEKDNNVFFKINSDGKDYENNGIPWSAKTLSQDATSNTTFNISGSVYMPDGTVPSGAIVYVTINGFTISTTTSSGGSYILPVSKYITSIENTTLLEMSVNAGPLGVSKVSIYPQAAKNTPPIILGKTYDFRTLTESPEQSLPESTLTVPEALEISSRFEVIGEIATDAKTVTLESINEGEVITTLDPEFFGSAPAKAEIEITVESEAQTEVIVAPTTGKWSWSPTNELEPGRHTITIKWKDASGIARTITRSFYVQASEGPAFEATPSATPTLAASTTPVATQTTKATPTAIATIRATQSPTTTPTVTAPPTPESGNLTPTLGLFIMGLGVFLSSIFVLKNS